LNGCGLTDILCQISRQARSRTIKAAADNRTIGNAVVAVDWKAGNVCQPPTPHLVTQFSRHLLFGGAQIPYLVMVPAARVNGEAAGRHQRRVGVKMQALGIVGL
jgi:hypothetical protein